MISIVLYGRNDSYGYNLHKRAAVSLNCMAEVLTDDEDEILFVDYNTPDDFPTFPEAIADTLTEHARRLIRIFRVRPQVHELLFASRTHLKAVEPVSRNVAVRRSNPGNRWILSTNTDMIFVPRQGTSLTDLVAPLDGGFYCAPRFEIPETLWESYNRLDPAGIIAETREIGEALHLNEVVLGSDNILYDAPGDFQLMRREDLFDIHGFEEEMLLGWHVDSNISRRLLLLYNSIGDAISFVFGYHCDHTRQITPMHAPSSLENSIVDFIHKVDTAEAKKQANVWGLANFDIEEIRLNGEFKTGYRRALRYSIPQPLSIPSVVTYRSESYDKQGCTAEHVLPFLMDLFANARRDIRIGWVGEKDVLYQRFVESWNLLGFTSPVVDWRSNVEGKELPVATFIVNFGMLSGAEALRPHINIAAFFEVIFAESKYIENGGSPRRIVAVNAIHNRFESLVQTYVICGRTPFSARLRHGYLRADAMQTVQDWTGDMLVGQSGLREGGLICSTGDTDFVFYGPYRHLRPGSYRFELQLSLKSILFWAEKAIIDIAFNQQAHKVVEVKLRRGAQKIAIELSVDHQLSALPVELRLRTSKGTKVVLDSVNIYQTSPA